LNAVTCGVDTISFGNEVQTKGGDEIHTACLAAGLQRVTPEMLVAGGGCFLGAKQAGFRR
jgi:hypothetical protein